MYSVSWLSCSDTLIPERGRKHFRTFPFHYNAWSSDTLIPARGRKQVIPLVIVLNPTSSDTLIPERGRKQLIEWHIEYFVSIVQIPYSPRGDGNYPHIHPNDLKCVRFRYLNPREGAETDSCSSWCEQHCSDTLLPARGRNPFFCKRRRKVHCRSDTLLPERGRKHETLWLVKCFALV